MDKNKKVNFLYGDLINRAFKKKKQKEIFVIQVNDTFDVIIDDPTINNPLVSEKTLHGQFIKKYCETEKIDVNELNERIKKSLICYKSQYVVKEKIRGNQDRYELGTIAVLNSSYNNSIFFLIALSSFDSKNIAHVSSNEIFNILNKLLVFYDERGQGFPIFMAPFGIGKSRASLSLNQSCNLIKSSVAVTEIRDSINLSVIINKSNKKEFSIFSM